MELDFYVPTGLMIKEYLDMNQMTESDLANKLGLTDSFMKRIMDSSMPLTDELAVDISNAFNIGSEYFLEYEKGYREFLAKQKNK